MAIRFLNYWQRELIEQFNILIVSIKKAASAQFWSCPVAKVPMNKYRKHLQWPAFAQQRGIPAKQILLEDQSKNTYQNMLFSKRVATEDFGNSHFKARFFSNNYHIFRAGLLAREVGLKANGVGAYTRLYYLPNAIIREFAGVFVMHKRRHFIIMGVIVLFFILQTILAITGLGRFNII